MAALVIAVLSFTLGFFLAAKKQFPYSLVRNTYQNFFYKKEILKIKNVMNECSLEKVKKLPAQFSAVIGHAYGSSSSGDDFIAENVLKFLMKNRKNISSVIFTGDVFGMPSSKKWSKLFELYDNKEVHIAPGNHDIWRPSSREIFSENVVNTDMYPYVTYIEDFLVFVDDSITSKWLASDKLVEKINVVDNDIVIARHNIPISELLPIANSLEGKTELPDIQKLATQISPNKKVTWLIGDGGAFSHLPRLSCYEFKNHRFIINGVGEVQGDTVLVLKDKKILQHVIE